jgi:hypothetical protein
LNLLREKYRGKIEKMDRRQRKEFFKKELSKPEK